MKALLFVALLAFVLNAADFPVGTYTSCVQVANNPSGNNFLRGTGFQDGARLTVAQTGTVVTSKYVDQNGLTQSLSFSATTGTLATIEQRGQVIPGFKSMCVRGPGRSAGYPASMTVTGGALAYDAGMVFLTLTGDLRSNAGECGALSQPDATFWVSCENRQGRAIPAFEAGPAPVANLPAGPHSCRTQIDTADHLNGRNTYSGGGGIGTLTLIEDGPTVTARYSGGGPVAGSLRFKANTATSARAEPGQSLTTSCMGTGGPSDMLPIAAGSLTMIDATLFLSFAGTKAESSSCPGERVTGVLICLK